MSQGTVVIRRAGFRLHSSPDKATLVLMTDQAFRSNKPSRAVEQFNHSVSYDHHRYGNLGSRAAEARAEVL